PTPTPRVAVVGPATARAAAEAGWAVAVEGRGPGARGLAGQVAATFPLVGARVLFPAASGAAPTVEEEFTALGARVTRVEAYRTVATPPPAARVRADLAAGLDAVTFASPSAVEAVDRALGGEMAGGLAGLAVVCIGPTTAAALARRGVGNVRVAATATLEGMVEALVDSFGNPGSGRRDADLGHASSRAAVQSRAARRPDADLGRATHTIGATTAPNPGARP
ncbi:MAG: uroporphyrinogen-III synthase, partial [Gammaproteobacteria bacterium]|nr:uroporphyrinogen-III synthase [Gammaproteobacteria bacterium]